MLPIKGDITMGIADRKGDIDLQAPPYKIWNSPLISYFDNTGFCSCVSLALIANSKPICCSVLARHAQMLRVWYTKRTVNESLFRYRLLFTQVTLLDFRMLGIHMILQCFVSFIMCYTNYIWITTVLCIHGLCLMNFLLVVNFSAFLALCSFYNLHCINDL